MRSMGVDIKLRGNVHLDGVAVWVHRRTGSCHRSIHASLDGMNNHNVMLFDLNSARSRTSNVTTTSLASKI